MPFLTQFVGRDVINKNTTDLAVRCSTGSVIKPFFSETRVQVRPVDGFLRAIAH